VQSGLMNFRDDIPKSFNLNECYYGLIKIQQSLLDLVLLKYATIVIKTNDL
jgi:hypothetical protein